MYNQYNNTSDNWAPKMQPVGGMAQTGGYNSRNSGAQANFGNQFSQPYPNDAGYNSVPNQQMSATAPNFATGLQPQPAVTVPDNTSLNYSKSNMDG